MAANGPRIGRAGGRTALVASTGALALLLACRVAPPSAAALPDGIVGDPYRARIPGADAAASWRLAEGRLPEGLALEAASGTVAGTPVRPGDSVFTVVGLYRTPKVVARMRLMLRVRPGQVGAVGATPTPQPARWEGTYDYQMFQRVPAGDQISTAHVQLTLVEDAAGALEGTADGTVDATLTLSTCPSHTVEPATFHARLTGTRTPQRMNLALADQSWGPITVTPCPSGGLPGVIGDGRIYRVEEALEALTSEDGRVYRFHSERTYPSGQYPFTVTHQVEVHRVDAS